MSDLDRCGVPHPKRSGVFCTMPAHSTELCHSGGVWIWWEPTDATFREALLPGRPITDDEKMGRQLGKAVLAMAARHQAIATGVREALQEGLVRKPDLLLDRDGDAWVPAGVDGDVWRTGGVGEARSREDVEQSYGPVTEYYLGKGPEND